MTAKYDGRSFHEIRAACERACGELMEAFSDPDMKNVAEKQAVLMAEIDALQSNARAVFGEGRGPALYGTASPEMLQDWTEEALAAIGLKRLT